MLPTGQNLRAIKIKTWFTISAGKIIFHLQVSCIKVVPPNHAPVEVPTSQKHVSRNGLLAQSIA